MLEYLDSIYFEGVLGLYIFFVVPGIFMFVVQLLLPNWRSWCIAAIFAIPFFVVAVEVLFRLPIESGRHGEFYYRYVYMITLPVLGSLTRAASLIAERKLGSRHKALSIDGLGIAIALLFLFYAAELLFVPSEIPELEKTE